MKFAALITLLASSLVTAELGGLLICNGANATGPCYYDKYELSTPASPQCHELRKGWAQNSSTFAPDGDDFYCYPQPGKCTDICTSPEGCTLGGINFTSPYKYDLGKADWTTLIGRFYCYAGNNDF